MSRREDVRTELKRESDEHERDEPDNEVDSGLVEPATPLIDQDVDESVNAALHDADE